MKLFEVQGLIQYIAATEGRSFPDGAAVVWHDLLGDLPGDRVMDAARAHYRINDGTAPKLMPAAIRSRVREAIEHDRRTAQHAVERSQAPVELSPRGQAARAAVRALAARWGDLERETRPTHLRPDSSAPEAPDSGITAEAKARARAALSRARVA